MPTYTDSTILSMIYSHHAIFEKLNRKLELLKIEAEKRKII